MLQWNYDADILLLLLDSVFYRGCLTLVAICMNDSSFYSLSFLMGLQFMFEEEFHVCMFRDDDLFISHATVRA